MGSRAVCGWMPRQALLEGLGASVIALGAQLAADRRFLALQYRDDPGRGGIIDSEQFCAEYTTWLPQPAFICYTCKTIE